MTASLAAQKKLALASVLACGPLATRGSNSFLLNPPTSRQNGDFYKAYSPADWYLAPRLVGVPALTLGDSVIFKDRAATI